MYPSSDPAMLLDKRIMSLVQYARKVEEHYYKMADSLVSKRFDVFLQYYKSNSQDRTMVSNNKNKYSTKWLLRPRSNQRFTLFVPSNTNALSETWD